jgi:phosphoglycolate phosphatase
MIHAVLFDLDGTLLDSAPDLVGTLNDLRAEEQLAPLDIAGMRHLVNQGAAGLIRGGMPEAGDDVMQDRLSWFLRRYARRSFRESHLFEGVSLVLERLATAGIPWGIVTNKTENLTFPILKAAGLQAAACVICGDTIQLRKPHPAPVLLACELMGVAPSSVIMVGDDPRDVRSGLAAGTRAALALYGYLPPGFDSSAFLGQESIQKPRDLLTLIGLAAGPDQIFP